jgi:small ligand-binding sensory domain FIST
MRWASTLSREPDPAQAFGDVADGIEQQLEGRAPDLVLAFVSPEHARACEDVLALAASRFPRALVAGCTAGGVIGGAREAEEGPAFSLTAAALPGATLSAFRVEPGRRAGGDASEWRARIGCPPEASPRLLLLSDPFTTDVGALIEVLDRAYPAAPKFGGLASGGAMPGENRLFVGEEVHDAGAVGIAFQGDVAVDTLVAQGCRPIGAPMRVTRCRQTLLQELDGRPPLEALAELYGALDVRDRELLQHSLHVGLEVRSAESERGELLVRNIVGADEDAGTLAVGAELRPMMVAQFVVRDAHAAEQELQSMLARHRRAGAGRPAGALLFSCVGRGAGLFGAVDHDTSLFEEQLGPAPLGGFFCNGEIGPVGGATFLHGYTSAFAMFREPRAGDAGIRAGGEDARAVH